MYVLNGKTMFKDENIFSAFDDEIQLYRSYFNFISLGCAYGTTGSRIKTTQGQFTDLQASLQKILVHTGRRSTP